jgi:hypothetical protein
MQRRAKLSFVGKRFELNYGIFLCSVVLILVIAFVAIVIVVA